MLAVCRAARHLRLRKSAHAQATRMARALAGPAATIPLPMWGAKDVHTVGWFIVGELGWLVTALNVASRFAKAAAPSTSAPGAAARVRKPVSRPGSMTT